jgi:hypothetical protein
MCDNLSGSGSDSVVITQFYTKLEEKHKALEVEKDEAEDRKKVRRTCF